MMNKFHGLFLAASAAAGLGACATTSVQPDLQFSDLVATPTEATAGTPVTINSILLNAGAGPTAAPATVDIDFYADSAGQPLAPATGWRQRDGETLLPGAMVEDVASISAPALSPGAYLLCAVADIANAIPETDETNNRRCIPYAALAGAPRRADLVIEKVVSHGQDQASTKVTVTIRNAGSQAAGPFRIMAFRRSPRQPILLIECPLTEGQLASGSPASCNDLTQKTSLAAGASAELTGWLSYVAAGGASFVRTPVGPGNPNPLTQRALDFMVDGCFPPSDGSPVYCAVDEIDELNNFKGATLKVR